MKILKQDFSSDEPWGKDTKWIPNFPQDGSEISHRAGVRKIGKLNCQLVIRRAPAEAQELGWRKLVIGHPEFVKRHASQLENLHRLFSSSFRLGPGVEHDGFIVEVQTVGQGLHHLSVEFRAILCNAEKKVDGMVEHRGATHQTERGEAEVHEFSMMRELHEGPVFFREKDLVKRCFHVRLQAHCFSSKSQENGQELWEEIRAN